MKADSGLVGLLAAAAWSIWNAGTGA
jgi:hypothetical protein